MNSAGFHRTHLASAPGFRDWIVAVQGISFIFQQQHRSTKSKHPHLFYADAFISLAKASSMTQLKLQFWSVEVSSPHNETANVWLIKRKLIRNKTTGLFLSEDQATKRSYFETLSYESKYHTFFRFYQHNIIRMVDNQHILQNCADSELTMEKSYSSSRQVTIYCVWLCGSFVLCQLS